MQSLLAAIQTLTLLSSSLILLINLSGASSLNVKQVSSANKRGVTDEQLIKSLIYSKNSNGPRVEP